MTQMLSDVSPSGGFYKVQEEQSDHGEHASDHCILVAHFHLNYPESIALTFAKTQKATYLFPHHS
jgi:hypothetical protein